LPDVQATEAYPNPTKLGLHIVLSTADVLIMEIPVVEFSREGYKIRKVFV
jgi:hypothetical protein